MGWIFILIGIIFVGFAVYKWMFPGKSRDSSPQSRMVRIQDKHSPEQTRFEARKETKAAQARTEQATQLGAEARAVKDMIDQQREADEAEIHRAHAPHRMRRQDELEEEAHVAGVLDFQLHQQLTKLAMEQGTTVDVLMSYIQKEKLDDLEIRKLEREARIKIESALLFQLRQFHQVLMIGRSIDGLLEEIDRIEQDGSKSDRLKQRMIAEREDDIEFLRDKRRAERTRLLQASNGKDAGRGDQDTGH